MSPSTRPTHLRTGRHVTALIAFFFVCSFVASSCTDRSETIAGPSGPVTNASGTRQISSSGAILPNLPATPTFAASTVPANGDVNPYGVAFVPDGFDTGAGILKFGDILVSNFNNSSNVQGTGTTIVRISASGEQSLFFHGKRTLGLTTALGVLRAGFVIVGNVPSIDQKGTCTQGERGRELGVSPGSLLVLDATGDVVATLDGERLAGPWDLAVNDQGSTAQIFVSDVLSGTVTRLDLRMSSSEVHVVAETQIASGYVHRCDPAALVVGPTGLAWDSSSDVLYVASTGDNAIFAVARASTATSDHGKGEKVVDDQAHLHGPLGLARASNGDLISSQGDAVNPDPNQPSEIVEFTPRGEFVSQFSINSAPGSAFGLALMQRSSGFVFAAVDDGQNVLDVWKSERPR